jgi:hypothetical protein
LGFPPRSGPPTLPAGAGAGATVARPAAESAVVARALNSVGDASRNDPDVVAAVGGGGPPICPKLIDTFVTSST